MIWDTGVIWDTRFTIPLYHSVTNLPSATNCPTAFLFLLTSAQAPLIRLSYVKMLWMALPYTIVLNIVGMVAI